MRQPKLKGLSIHMSGAIVTFPSADVVAFGETPAGAVVVVKQGEELVKYVGFPTVFRLELSSIEVVSPHDGGLG